MAKAKDLSQAAALRCPTLAEALAGRLCTKPLITKLARQIYKGERALNEALALSRDGEGQLCRRASWLVASAISAHRNHYRRHLPALLEATAHQPDLSAKRNLLMGVLRWRILSEEELGLAWDVALGILAKPNLPPGLAHNAYKLAERVMKVYPELRGEMEVVVRG